MGVARAPPIDAGGGAGEMQRERTDLRQTSNHIELLIHILKQQGFEDVPFAVVALDGAGRAQVHASGQVKDCLDERLFASKFEEAQTLSLQRARPISSACASPDTFTMDQSIRALHPTEDELIQHQQPSLGATKRRLLRTARNRGRSTVVQDLSPFAVTPFPQTVLPPSSLKEEQAGSSAFNQDAIVEKAARKSFRIDSEEDVTAYLESRLKRLQQLAGKKIAKAWIKGICPKKQARFPYHNKKRKNATGEQPRIPGWWPRERGVCRFVEPDHIKREERMKLCLHLLRLRPSPQQLRAWNDDSTEVNQTHVMHGWTAFLKELAGPDLFDDLPREAPNRVKLRHTLLAQMYTVAAMEEQYQKDEIDAGELYFWTEDEEEEKKPTMPKRSRSMTSSVGDDSRPSSVSGSCNRLKRARGDSEHALGRTEPTFELESEIVEEQGLDRERSSHWENVHDRVIQETDIAVAPIIPLTQGQMPPDDGQSPWINVQSYPGHGQTLETAKGDGAFAWLDTTVSIASRKRALRAQRQALAEQVDNSMGFTPIKQEVHAPTLLPQGGMPSFPTPRTDAWNATTPYCAPQNDNAAAPRPYPPTYGFTTQPQYDCAQYTSASMSQLPLSAPSSHAYPAQAPLEAHVCLSLDCCDQGNSAAMHHVPPMPSREYTLPFGPEAFDAGMQQPWQHQSLPERYLQPPNEVSTFFYAPSEGDWEQRG